MPERAAPRVAFRTDASHRIGRGHLRRCATLADRLRGRGAEVLFVCREGPGDGIDELRRAGMKVAALPPSGAAGDAADGDYASWLGVPPPRDAAETAAALEGARPDLLVVDHYGLDAAWDRALRSRVGRVLALDDLASRTRDCDLLLDPSPEDGLEERYRRLVPPGCRLLLGPRYALLQPEYAAAAPGVRDRGGPVERVLVSFGGADLPNVTGRALEALSEPAFARLAVDLVVGPSNPHRRVLETLAAARPGTTLHPSRPHLADLMAEADLAIGAGGATAWERLCLGLPSLVVSLAENQVPVCRTLAARSLIRYAGDHAAVTAGDLAAELGALLREAPTRAAMSSGGRRLVDGRGAERVTETVLPTASRELRLRPARREDAAAYFDWANEPEVRRQSLDSRPVEWEEHRAWFEARRVDPGCRLFVLEAQGLPVGQIRFELLGTEARLHYSLDCLVRGRGWGAQLVTLGARRLAEGRRLDLRAEVKEGNLPSCRVFRRLGFHEEDGPMEGVRTFTLADAGGRP